MLMDVQEIVYWDEDTVQCGMRFSWQVNMNMHPLAVDDRHLREVIVHVYASSSSCDNADYFNVSLK